MPYVRAKAWAKSRTIIVFVLTALVGVMETARESPLFEEHTGPLMLALGVVGILLRAFTSLPLSAHPTQDDGAAVDGVPPEPGVQG